MIITDIADNKSIRSFFSKVGKANAMMSLTGHTSAAWGPIYFVLRRSRASWATKTLQVDGCIVDIHIYVYCETLKFAEGLSSFAFRSCLDRHLSLQGGRARSQMARGGKQGFLSIGD